MRAAIDAARDLTISGAAALLNVMRTITRWRRAIPRS